MDTDDSTTKKDKKAAIIAFLRNDRSEESPSSSLSSNSYKEVDGIKIHKEANEHEHKATIAIDKFCGACRWKDTDFTCNDRVSFEVEKKKGKVSAEEAMITNLEFCRESNTEDHINVNEVGTSFELGLSDFCGICKWKEKSKTSCTAEVLFEVKTSGISIDEAKMANLELCFDPIGRLTHDMGDFILSPICGGCYRAKSGTIAGTEYNAARGLESDKFGAECNFLQHLELQKIMNEKNNITIVDKIIESNKVVAQKFKDCEICDVNTCWKRFFDEDDALTITKENKRFDTKYWRFDKTAPKIRKSKTIFLPSLPDEFRIPSSIIHGDIEKFLIEKYDSREGNYIPFLVEYNPSLVQIPLEMKSHLPPESAYLMTLRVTPANNCFKKEFYSNLKLHNREVWDALMWTNTNHLGLALLDSNYHMIPGYHAIIDLASEMEVNRKHRNSGTKSPAFMDYRLAVLNGEVYLNINADIVIITKLEIRSRDFVEHDERIKRNNKINIKPLYGGEKLEITLCHQFNTIWSGGHSGKNYALFTVPNATQSEGPDSIYAEINISPYHKVSQIYPDEIDMLDKKDAKKRRKRNLQLDSIMRRKVKSNNATVSNISPHASFSTVDEHWFPGNSAPFEPFSPMTHGGACCVELRKSQILPVGNSDKTFGDHEYLLVGIAHSPLDWRPWHSNPDVPESDKARLPIQHYLSFFYAFEPYPPFNLRTRSGFFCLGYPDEDEGMVNPNSELTFNRKFQHHNETFNCPQIHFVSTLVEKVDETDTI